MLSMSKNKFIFAPKNSLVAVPLQPCPHFGTFIAAIHNPIGANQI